MGIIAWIVLGAIAGFIASLIMGSSDGLIMMVVLGIVGAVVGGYLAGNVLGLADVTGVNVESIVAADWCSGLEPLRPSSPGTYLSER
jgi:uncharacterized membrane protein YeaQ/YmgE (transglycosylase-associated protein family)